MKWSTVKVTDREGKRYSLDVEADSTYDAAHVFLTKAKEQPAAALPIPSLDTMFEVSANGNIYNVPGVTLQNCILRRRSDPKGLLFNRRPMFG